MICSTPRVVEQPDQTKRLQQTLQDYGQWQQYANNALQLRKSGGDYTSLVASGAGKNIMDDIRAQMGTFIQSEEAMRDTLVTNAQQTTQIVIYSSLGLALIVGALLAFYSRRQLLLLSNSYNQAFALARERADQVAEQRERLQVTLASIGDGVIVTDVDGKVTFANPVAQTLTGWKQADAHGQPLEQVFAIINEETRRQVENPVAKVLREGTVVGLANHTILIARHGPRCRSTIAPRPSVMRAARSSAWCWCFAISPSANKLSKPRHSSQYRSLKSASDSTTLSPAFQVLCGKPGGSPTAPRQSIDFVSNYVETLLGYSVQEWLQTPNFWLTIVHPDDRERAAAEAASIFAGDKTDGLSEFRWIARDGRAIWVESHSAVILGANGQPARDARCNYGHHQAQVSRGCHSR